MSNAPAFNSFAAPDFEVPDISHPAWSEWDTDLLEELGRRYPQSTPRLGLHWSELVKRLCLSGYEGRLAESGIEVPV